MQEQVPSVFATPFLVSQQNLHDVALLQVLHPLPHATHVSAFKKYPELHVQKPWSLKLWLGSVQPQTPFLRVEKVLVS
ncbi:unnamed protein product [Blepharisma stoltei]|uniref:Uncharacterized protein n=1 Tax=Blepharisma stoltei TaxID=1481888 RepID=A0AAU9KIZ8_9CILI|nr:unnamed protein product [Blepharisma stoltei]